MDNMIDDVNRILASRLREWRDNQGWSLAALARKSGVSKAMLSRIERGEASPTATTLVRIATAFDTTLADFLSFEDRDVSDLLVRDEQPIWADPATGYVRRQIYTDKLTSAEVVEIELPPKKKVCFPGHTFIGLRHVIWLLEGMLQIDVGNRGYNLNAGDRFVFGEGEDIVYSNVSSGVARYMVCVIKQ